MISLAARANHLRTRRAHEHSRVTYVELFFDLVFVFAITQLSHGLLERMTLQGGPADRVPDAGGVVVVDQRLVDDQLGRPR